MSEPLLVQPGGDLLLELEEAGHDGAHQGQQRIRQQHHERLNPRQDRHRDVGVVAGQRLLERAQLEVEVGDCELDACGSLGRARL